MGASYSIVVVSALVTLVSRPYGNFYYFPFDFLGGLLGGLPYVLSIAGLVLGPYFGTAGLIAEDNSVWEQAVRLIERHISFPFIAGAALAYGSGPIFASMNVIVWYAILVFLATLIVWKAKKQD